MSLLAEYFMGLEVRKQERNEGDMIQLVVEIKKRIVDIYSGQNSYMNNNGGTRNLVLNDVHLLICA